LNGFPETALIFQRIINAKAWRVTAYVCITISKVAAANFVFRQYDTLAMHINLEEEGWGVKLYEEEPSNETF
jgi:hypothetical protein